MLINTQIQPEPVPESGIQSGPTPTVYSDAGALLEEVGGILKDLEGLTSLFWAEDLSSRDQVFYWGPNLDLFSCLAKDLAKGAGPEVPRHDRFREPPDDQSAKATAAIQACLARLRSRNDINFALAWGVEDDEHQIELVGFTIDRVIAQISAFMAGEIERYLDSYWTFVRLDADRRSRL